MPHDFYRCINCGYHFNATDPKCPACGAIKRIDPDIAAAEQFNPDVKAAIQEALPQEALLAVEKTLE